jgi:hypothetical protein
MLYSCLLNCICFGIAAVRAAVLPQRGAGALREGLDDRHLLHGRHPAFGRSAALLPGGTAQCSVVGVFAVWVSDCGLCVAGNFVDVVNHVAQTRPTCCSLQYAA